MDIDRQLQVRAQAPDAARGRRLAVAMSMARCKRSELALICEVSERQITRYRSGEPIPAKLRRIICARCGISERQLVCGDDPAAPAQDTEAIAAAATGTRPPQNSPPAPASDTMLALNNSPIHRLHLHLLRHLRRLPGGEQAAALDMVINSRWVGPVAPFAGRAPVLDGVTLDRYEIAVVLALRAIADVGREVALIRQLLGTRLAD